MPTLVKACTANFEWILVEFLAAVMILYPLLRLG
jgi:hypothetical protein